MRRNVFGGISQLPPSGNIGPYFGDFLFSLLFQRAQTTARLVWNRLLESNLQL
jgi:hypothetical protein